MIQRIRTIKPEFFRHEGLFELEQETGLPMRLAFAGLWTCCDREGRFQWRPRELRTMIMPYDSLDFSRVLDALATRQFVVQYQIKTEMYGWIPSFSRHQVINNRESASTIPAPRELSEAQAFDASVTRQARVDDACPTPLKCAQGEQNRTERNRTGTEQTERETRAREQFLPDIETRLLKLVQSHPKSGDRFQAFEQVPYDLKTAMIDSIGKYAQAMNVSELDAYAHILKKTLAYRACVDNWPKQEHRFAANLVEWFSGARFDEPESLWERNQTQTGGNGNNGKRKHNGLDPDRSLERYTRDLPAGAVVYTGD